MPTTPATNQVEAAKPQIDWISMQQCAERYGVTTKTVRRWIDQRLIEAKRFGPKLIRVDADSVERMAKTLV